MKRRDIAPAAKPLDIAQFEGHTPGPWEAVGPRTANQHVVMTRTDNLGAFSQPDARLIAAAPALLAECKQRRADREEDCALIASQRKQIAELVRALREYVASDNVLTVANEVQSGVRAAAERSIKAHDTARTLLARFGEIS